MGDYTYYDDFDDVRNFERNVRYRFPFVGDKLRSGRFCQLRFAELRLPRECASLGTAANEVQRS